MNQKWNLQDIRPTERSTKRKPRGQMTHKSDIARKPHKQHATEVDSDILEIQDGNNNKRGRLITAVLVVFLVVIGAFVASILMGGAEITIFQKHKEVSVNATFTASLNPLTGELGYEILTLEAEGERQVAASGQETVSEKATGNIFIYNAYSKTPQRLIKNTRFESPDGRIYRITESVEVPGSTVDESGGTVPGVIIAEVFADGTGEDYNIDAARFTIPGLRGTDQYETMYAESTTAFSGGYDGTRYVIDDSELNTARQALHTELRNALLERIKSERPAGFVIFDDAITFVFDSLPATEYGDDLATIKERARLQVPVFKDSDFALFVADNTVAGFEGDPVVIEDTNEIIFSYPDPQMQTADIAELTEIEFNLSGSTLIKWYYDKSALKESISGKSKTALQAAISGSPAIERAQVRIRPFWKQSFPENSDEIEITEVLESGSE